MRQYTFISTILHLLINILLEKDKHGCTMKLKYIREANRPVILNYYNFEIFQYFLSSKSTFMTCPQTGRIQF